MGRKISMKKLTLNNAMRSLQDLRSHCIEKNWGKIGDSTTNSVVTGNRLVGEFNGLKPTDATCVKALDNKEIK